MRKREKGGDGECVSVCIELMEGGGVRFFSDSPFT